jgi:hypothetical protein
MQPISENVNFAHFHGILSSVLEPRGFRVFSPFGNRHGSWEETFYKSDDGGVYRYVSLDVTGATAPPSVHYDVEVWIAAEYEHRFARRMIRQLTARENELYSSEFDKQLIGALQVASEICSMLTVDDLLDSYPQSSLKMKR